MARMTLSLDEDLVRESKIENRESAQALASLTISRRGSFSRDQNIGMARPTRWAIALARFSKSLRASCAAWK